MSDPEVIQPVSVEQFGPGVDLEVLSGGISVKFDDPNPDFSFAANRVEMVFDLKDFGSAVLVCDGMIYGEEPHWPRRIVNSELGIGN